MPYGTQANTHSFIMQLLSVAKDDLNFFMLFLFNYYFNCVSTSASHRIPFCQVLGRFLYLNF